MTAGDALHGPTDSVGTSGPLPQWSPAPNPTRRPMLRTAITIGVIASLFLACLLLLVSIVGERLGAQTILVSVLMAIIPLFIIVPTYLWLDRYEVEPVRYQVGAFLWGAVVAVVGAFFLNTFGLKLLVEARWTEPLETGAVYLAPVTEETLKGLGILLIYLLRRREFDGIIDGIVYAGLIGAGFLAPVTEETLKGLGILLIYLLRRREFDGIIDGIVYAGLIGAGFAFSENILYLGQAYTVSGDEGLTSTFIVRCLMGPFGHPLFTSCIGIGIGIAVTTRSPAVRVLAIVLGWVCAIVLHGLWNLSALAGMDGFVEAYATYQVPLFLAFIGFLVWLRRREGRLIGQYLSPYADAGWLTHGEVTMLSSIQLRRAARDWAKATGGKAAKRSMDAFQDSASDLALLRSRLVHGTAEPNASERELVLLDAITAHRRDFVGSPVT